MKWDWHSFKRHFGLQAQNGSGDGDGDSAAAAAAAGFGGGEGVTSSVGVGNSTSVNTTNMGNVSSATGNTATGFGVSDMGSVNASGGGGGGGGSGSGGNAQGHANAPAYGATGGGGSSGMGTTAAQAQNMLSPAAQQMIAYMRSGIMSPISMFSSPASAETLSPSMVTQLNSLLNSPQPSPTYNALDPAQYGGTPAYGPGVSPMAGAVSNFGSGQGFGLGQGGQGDVGANASDTVQGIRAAIAAAAAQGVARGMSPAQAIEAAADAANYGGFGGGGTMGNPALGYNTAAATATNFGDPAMGPSAPVGQATAATMGAGNVGMQGLGQTAATPANSLGYGLGQGFGGPNAPSAFAGNMMGQIAAPPSFSQQLSQNSTGNRGAGQGGQSQAGGGMDRVSSGQGTQLMGGIHA